MATCRSDRHLQLQLLAVAVALMMMMMMPYKEMEAAEFVC